ncbi:hypothetical protein ACMBCN_00945 [Candidatus Liberibacter asiaticus]|nr:hypothetical protein [Candidatus Liberibacter asiaticus]
MLAFDHTYNPPQQSRSLVKARRRRRRRRRKKKNAQRILKWFLVTVCDPYIHSGTN